MMLLAHCRENLLNLLAVWCNRADRISRSTFIHKIYNHFLLMKCCHEMRQNCPICSFLSSFSPISSALFLWQRRRPFVCVCHVSAFRGTHHLATTIFNAQNAQWWKLHSVICAKTETSDAYPSYRLQIAYFCRRVLNFPFSAFATLFDGVGCVHGASEVMGWESQRMYRFCILRAQLMRENHHQRQSNNTLNSNNNFTLSQRTKTENVSWETEPQNEPFSMAVACVCCAVCGRFQ